MWRGVPFDGIRSGWLERSVAPALRRTPVGCCTRCLGRWVPRPTLAKVVACHCVSTLHYKRLQLGSIPRTKPGFGSALDLACGPSVLGGWVPAVSLLPAAFPCPVRGPLRFRPGSVVPVGYASALVSALLLLSFWFLPYSVTLHDARGSAWSVLSGS